MPLKSNKHFKNSKVENLISNDLNWDNEHQKKRREREKKTQNQKSKAEEEHTDAHISDEEI